MTRRSQGRPLERSLAVSGGVLRCPRRGGISATDCVNCPFFCRHDDVTRSVICSYPLLARDTFARRTRWRENVRIALAHHLERT
jgi:hypothetical protein